jgi:hypothetical protein
MVVLDKKFQYSVQFFVKIKKCSLRMFLLNNICIFLNTKIKLY